MIDENREKGVSPVIGVILMVAITVIIAAVVATFVLNLGSTLQQNAQASVDTDQEVSNFSGPEYDVTVTVSGMQNADYLVVTSPEGNNFTANYAGKTASSASDVPKLNQTQYTKGSVVHNPGDRVIVESLSAGDTVQVLGFLEGSSNEITRYEVVDTFG